MTSLVLTITETLRYRGAIGQWSWVLHRLSGLGVVLFVTLHIVDTSWAYFYPELYVKAIAAYQTPLFTIGEFGLVACVVYHAFNGLRIGLMDNRPVLWRQQAKAAYIVLAATIVVLIPVFFLMFGHVLKFYGDPESKILPLSEVLLEQARFGVGIGAAVVAALLMSAIAGLFMPKSKTVGAKKGSRIEKFWWMYMRLSGLLIVPLVFGHLAMMHIIQGVFDITAQNFTVVGTDLLNQSGTATEFVANRWNFFLAGVAVWRLYDFGLLALVVVHGFNGLRYVLTDYPSFSPFLKRAMIYLCVIGAVVLLVLGTGALLGTIDHTALEMAQKAAEQLHP